MTDDKTTQDNLQDTDLTQGQSTDDNMQAADLDSDKNKDNTDQKTINDLTLTDETQAIGESLGADANNISQLPNGMGLSPGLNADDVLIQAANPAMGTPAAPIATVPPQVVTEMTDKSPKSSKSRKKIIWISIIASILIAAIVLSIALPLAFHFKDKVMVKTADDFVYQTGKHFVLANDIQIDGDLNMSNLLTDLDLNKHTLTVTGTLIIDTPSQVSLNYGEENGKAYTKGGLINAHTLTVNMPQGNLYIGANLIFQNLYATANSLTIAGDIQSSTANIQIKDCQSVTMSSNSQSTVNLDNSNFVQTDSSTIQLLKLSSNSTAQIYGKVTQEINGGKKVAVLGEFSCPLYKDIMLLALNTNKASGYSAQNCGSYVYVEKLETPNEMIMQTNADGSVTATISQVLNAQQYCVQIGDQIVQSQDNVLDLTQSLMKMGAGKYEIYAYVMGNYSFDQLDSTQAIKYLDSDKLKVKYSYELVLEKPQDLKIENVNNKLMLSFNQVQYADKYTVYFNGEKLTVISKNDAPVITYDLTEQLSSAGMHTIKVVASSKKSHIQSSPQAMTSYLTKATLGEITNLNCIYENGNINLMWNGIANAKSYTVYIQNADGSQVVLGKTSVNSFFVNYPNATVGQSIYVVADSYGYFNQSQAVGINIIGG